MRLVSDQLRHSGKGFEDDPLTRVKEVRKSQVKFYIRTCVFRRWSRRRMHTETLIIVFEVGLELFSEATFM